MVSPTAERQRPRTALSQRRSTPVSRSLASKLPRNSQMSQSAASTGRPSTAQPKSSSNVRSRLGKTGGSELASLSVSVRKKHRAGRRKRGGGITLQQSAGQSGARNDLEVLRTILERECVLTRLRKCAKEYLKQHRWANVSVRSIVESSRSKDEGGKQNEQSEVTSAEGGAAGGGHDYQAAELVDVESAGGVLGPLSSKAELLANQIIRDLGLLRRAGIRTCIDIFRWRQDRVLTLEDRRNPAGTRPVPFIFDGDDYLLRMLTDLDFLRDIPPVTEWLGAPCVRNPFVVEGSSPYALSNLEMQLDEDLIKRAHIKPPALRDAAEVPKALMWASGLLLAQEAIFGQPPLGVPVIVGTPSTMLQGSLASSTSDSAKVDTLSVSHGMKRRSLPLRQDSTFHEPAVISSNSVTHPRTNDEKKARGSEPLGNHSKRRQVTKVTVSRVRQVIEQNMSLRKELERMKRALQLEEELVARLEAKESRAETLNVE